MAHLYTREDALGWLVTMQEQLLAQGICRLPKRGDFSNAQVVAIKAFLGPWPRALEAAGLKAPRIREGANTAMTHEKGLDES